MMDAVPPLQQSPMLELLRSRLTRCPAVPLKVGMSFRPASRR
jgi:hypothetical protein